MLPHLSGLDCSQQTSCPNLTFLRLEGYVIKDRPLRRRELSKREMYVFVKGPFRLQPGLPCKQEFRMGSCPSWSSSPHLPIPSFTKCFEEKESHPLTCTLRPVSLLSRAPAGVSSALALHHPDKFTGVKSQGLRDGGRGAGSHSVRTRGPFKGRKLEGQQGRLNTVPRGVSHPRLTSGLVVCPC